MPMPPKFSPDVRECAAQMIYEVRESYDSPRAEKGDRFEWHLLKNEILINQLHK